MKLLLQYLLVGLVGTMVIVGMVLCVHYYMKGSAFFMWYWILLTVFNSFNFSFCVLTFGEMLNINYSKRSKF